MRAAGLLKIAREGGQMTPRDLAKFEPRRRYATLVAVTLERRATVTDEIIDLHDRIMGRLFKQPRTNITIVHNAHDNTSTTRLLVVAHRSTESQVQLMAARSKGSGGGKEGGFNRLAASWGPTPLRARAWSLPA
jgi:hypothetical protein